MESQTSLSDISRALGDRYAIENELGRGGMGAVYLARDLKLDRLVALKVLPPEFASDPGLRERFLRETRTAASFSHPNIVPVHAVEDRDGVLAFAMGFVEGESLSQRIRRTGPLDLRGIVRVLQDIGYALAYAHGRGVVHRDIKPDNIMLERATGRALLMDFGISRTITATVEKQGLTRVGEVVGTPEYMSPEQASGDVVDGRSDIYSLGLVALFALTGRPVITDDSTQKILVKQLTELPPAAVSLRPDLPPILGDAVDRCVAKLPDDRFPTAEALVETIDAAQVAAPEIPLPIRMFAQEAGTLGLVLTFLVIITWLLVKSMTKDLSLSLALVPAAMLMAIGITRILQASSMARRLALGGFEPADVLKGMRSVVDEREGLRAQLRNDPDTLRRRKLTRVSALAMLPGAFMLMYLSRMIRFTIGGKGMNTFETPPPTDLILAAPTARIMMAAAGVSLLGVAFILLVRSPFRMPVGERLFRKVWLGFPGRAFLRLSMRGVQATFPRRPAVTSAVRAAVPVVPQQPIPAPKTADPIAALETRVKELELWRKKQENG
jgi:eukaryotic-like serine/threonine-protein kinase